MPSAHPSRQLSVEWRRRSPSMPRRQGATLNVASSVYRKEMAPEFMRPHQRSNPRYPHAAVICLPAMGRGAQAHRSLFVSPARPLPSVSSRHAASLMPAPIHD